MGYQNSPKIYCSNGTAKQDKFGNEMLILKFTDKDVAVMQQQLTVNKQKGVQCVQIYINRRKDVGKFGETHYGTINTSQKPYSESDKGSAPQQAQQHRYNDSDLPDQFPN